MTGAQSVRGKAAIVGVGLGGYAPDGRLGEAKGRTDLEILGQAVHGALQDAGLSLQDVDGLFGASMMTAVPALVIGEYLGLSPDVVDGTNVGGSSFMNHLQWAALALDAGLCSVALVCYGSNQRTRVGGRGAQRPETPWWVSPYKPRPPISGYALSAHRHMHVYGTTSEQLAEVAVAARAWANMNPEAFMSGPLSADDVLSSRMICDPLHLLDCCLVTDGGGAAILVRADRAKDFPKPPVYVLGVAAAQDHMQVSEMPDLATSAAAKSGPRAFAMAGVTPTEIDVVMLYDAFTINTILFLEDLGFCPKGEGGRFVEGGAIAPGGRLAVNTNGGGLSCVHPGMYGMFTLIEAIRQLRGEAGARQVAGAKLAVAHGNGGMLSSQVTSILGTAETL
ncbi:MAG: acetyl-CoA acetyltransferase [Alphaproteobacteria bacterium]